MVLVRHVRRVWLRVMTLCDAAPRGRIQAGITENNARPPESNTALIMLSSGENEKQT